MKGTTAAKSMTLVHAQFPGALRRVRRKRGMTQTEVGELFDVSVVEVSRWEAGTRIPRAAKMIEVLEWIDDEPI